MVNGCQFQHFSRLTSLNIEHEGMNLTRRNLPQFLKIQIPYHKFYLNKVHIYAKRRLSTKIMRNSDRTCNGRNISFILVILKNTKRDSMMIPSPHPKKKKTQPPEVFVTLSVSSDQVY